MTTTSHPAGGRPRADPQRTRRRARPRGRHGRRRHRGQRGGGDHGLRPSQPMVVVADLQLQDGTGLDIVRTVRKKNDTTGLIVLTMHSGDDQIFAGPGGGVRVRRQGRAGDRGDQGGPPCQGLAEGVRVCRPGGRDDASPLSGRWTSLTEREHDVLLLLAEGLRGAAIGAKLYLVGVDDQVPHRPDLPESRGREPCASPRHRHADRPAVDRAAVGPLRIKNKGCAAVVRSDYGGRDEPLPAHGALLTVRVKSSGFTPRGQHPTPEGEHQ